MLKTSDEFLDPLFQNFYHKLELPNMMRKTDYHTLAPFVTADQLGPRYERSSTRSLMLRNELALEGTTNDYSQEAHRSRPAPRCDQQGQRRGRSRSATGTRARCISGGRGGRWRRRGR